MAIFDNKLAVMHATLIAALENVLPFPSDVRVVEDPRTMELRVGITVTNDCDLEPARRIAAEVLDEFSPMGLRARVYVGVKGSGKSVSMPTPGVADYKAAIREFGISPEALGLNVNSSQSEEERRIAKLQKLVAEKWPGGSGV